MKPDLSALKSRVQAFARNRRDPDAAPSEFVRTQRTIITANTLSGIAGGLVGGNYFTGLLLFLNASTVQIGLTSIVAPVCNIAQLLAPLFIERFETRKRLLIGTRIISHIANIVLIGLLSVLPASESSRVYMILGVQALLNLIGAFTSAGYSVWQMQSVPERDRANYFSLSQRVSSVTTYLMLIASAVADRFRGTPEELTGYLILRAAAVVFAALDVICLSRVKEYPYHKSEQRVNLKVLLTEPLKAKRYRISLLVIFVWNMFSMSSGAYYGVYILDTVKASYSFLNICSVLATPVLLVVTPLWARYINRTSWFSVFWKVAFIYGFVSAMQSFITVNNFMWTYPVAQILLFTLSPAINLFVSNLAYHNIPRENQTVYLSFFSTVANLAAVIATLISTQYMLFTEGMTFNIFGVIMLPEQFIAIFTGSLISLAGIIVFFFSKNEEKIKKKETAALASAGEYDGPF